MITGQKTESSEYISNIQAQVSNDRAFSRTSMSQHHEASKTSISSSTSDKLCIISKNFGITTSDQPTLYNVILKEIL